MDILALFLVLVLAISGGALAIRKYMVYAQPDRERELREELEALQAVQRLSIAAWQARQYMADVVRGDVIDET